MDFSTGMLEAQQAARDNWHGITSVVHPRKLTYLRVKERSPGLVANARRPKRGTLDRRSLREIKFHEQRIEFRERSAQRVTDLCQHDEIGTDFPKRSSSKPTWMTWVEEYLAINRLTSTRICGAVFWCSSAKPE
jgi:hypothetical protein